MEEVIDYKVLGKEDKNRVADFLVKNYLPRAGCYEYLQVTPEEFIKYRLDCFEDILTQGNSIGAFTRDEELCGVLINVENLELTSLVSKTKTASRPIQIIEAPGIEVWKDAEEVLTTKNFWEMELATVSPSYGKRGILQELISRSHKLAKKKKFDVLMAICSGDYSHRAFMKNGFKTLRKLNNVDFVCPVTNKREFKNIKPPFTFTYLVMKEVGEI